MNELTASVPIGTSIKQSIQINYILRQTKNVSVNQLQGVMVLVKRVFTESNAMSSSLTDEQPNVAFAVHFLFIDIAQNAPCSCYVEKADHNSGSNEHRMYKHTQSIGVLF